jgi:hypothetical protein
VALPGVHQVKFAKIDTAASGDTALVAAVAGSKLTVIGFFLTSTSALSITFKSGSTALSGAMAVAALGTLAVAGSPSAPLFQAAAGSALNINLSGSTQVSGSIAYIEEA